MQTTKCQRWNQRRETYRPAGEPIDTRRYEVIPIEEAAAKEFVVSHHYSCSYPAARYRTGILRLARFRKPELVGVAVFSVPMNNSAIPKYCGVTPNEGVELGRLVLKDCVESNGESWFLGRSFRLLASERPDIKAILSYSDPVPRYRRDGTIITPGHVGTCMAAHNGRYIGRSRARTLILSDNGLVVSERMLSKLRNDDCGAAYAYEALRRLGAPRRLPLESGRDYVARALREGPFQPVRHPGNHAYLWAIGDRRARMSTMSRFPAARPYPKTKDALVVLPKAA